MTLTPSKLKKLQQTTILIEGIDCAIIAGKARQRMTVGSLTVNAGQQCWSVRSSDDATRFYVVAWSERDSAYLCSCGCPAYKQHKHTQMVNTYIAARRVNPASATTKQLPRATAVATKQLTSSQPDDNTVVPGSLSSNKPFNMYR
jgi:hypothetical protein